MQKYFEIRPVIEGDFDTLKKLWACCFDDSDKVIDNFFEKTAEPQNIIATFYGDKAINAMYLLDSEIKVNDKSYSAYYIYAVCTEPSYRGSGIMKKAFSYLEDLVVARKIDYVFLVPANEGLFSMYKKLGFKTGLTYEEEVVRCGNATPSEEFNTCLNYKKYSSFREKYSCSVPLVTLKEKAFNSFYSPVEESVWCLCTEDGYAVCENDEGKIIVHELFGNENVFIDAIAHRYKCEKMFIRKPSLKSESIPFGMYRSFNEVPEIKDAFFGIPYGV